MQYKFKTVATTLCYIPHNMVQHREFNFLLCSEAMHTKTYGGLILNI